MKHLFTACQLCPRDCKVDRTSKKVGYCGQTDQIKAARASLHLWEEPCISGESGSGTVFFSGCPLRCVYCQNHDIALGKTGAVISISRLAEIFLELQQKGALNINLVTPTHFVPLIAEAIKEAKIREAEGEAEAILKVEQARAKAIGLINEAAPGQGYLTIKSLEAFEAAADGQATKLIIPSDLQGVAGLAASAKEILSDK